MDIQKVLLDFDATIQAKPELSDDELLQKFPEFENDATKLVAARDYSATLNSDKYKGPEEFNDKFPEFFEVKKKDGTPTVGTPSESTSPSSLPSSSGVGDPVDPAIAERFAKKVTGSTNYINSFLDKKKTEAVDPIDKAAFSAFYRTAASFNAEGKLASRTELVYDFLTKKGDIQTNKDTRDAFISSVYAPSYFSLSPAIKTELEKSELKDILTPRQFAGLKSLSYGKQVDYADYLQVLKKQDASPAEIETAKLALDQIGIEVDLDAASSISVKNGDAKGGGELYAQSQKDLQGIKDRLIELEYENPYTLNTIKNIATRAFDRGLAMGGTADILTVTSENTGISVEELAKYQAAQEDARASKAYQIFSENPTLENFKANPLGILIDLVTESGVALYSHGASRIAAGTVAGAGLGSVVPGIGTAVGGSYGAIAGTGLASLNLEYSSTIIEGLRQSGVDVTNAQSLRDAFANDEMMVELKKKGLQKGVPVAIFDMLSAGIAGKIITKPATGIIKKALATTAEVGIQAGLGGAGEAAGQIVSEGKITSPNAIVMEMIGEFGPGSVEIATGAMIETYKKGKKASAAQAVNIATKQDPKVTANIIDANVASGNLTKEQGEAAKKDISEMSAKAAKVPSELTPDAKAEVITLIDQKKELEQQVQNLDATFKPEVTQKIKELETKIIEVVNKDREAATAAPELSKIESAKPEDFTAAPTAEGYAEKMAAAKESLGADGISVDVYAQEDYDKIAAEGGQFVSNADGTAMGALKPSGEIVSIVKSKENTQKGVAPAMLEKMKQLGGLFMDNFDIYLTKQYEKAGFKVVARLPFNEEFAPEGWQNSPLKDKPDVVFMARSEFAPAEEKAFTDYDEAKAYTEGLAKAAVEAGTVQSPSQVTTEFADKVIDKANKNAPVIENVEKALQATGVKVEVIEDEAEFNNKVGQQGLGGVFLAEDGSILLNKASLDKSVNAGRIIFHEGAHPVMNIIRNTNKPLYDKVVAGMKAAAKGNQAVKASVQWANRNYEGQEIMDDEALIETIAKIADGTLKLGNIDAGFRQAVIDFINTIAKSLNLPPVKDTDIVAFKKLAGEVAGALKEGRDVSEIVGAENVTRTENNLESPEVFIAGEMNKGGQAFKLTTEPAIDIYESKEVSKLPVKTIEEVYNEYGGKATVINSDPTRVGELTLPSGKKIFMYGGPGYLSIKENVDGAIGFATTQPSKVKSWAKYVSELFGTAKGVTLIGTQAPTSMMSNSYALRYVLDAISTLPKSVLKSKEFKDEFFGKDLVLLKDAFGEKGYNDFVNKYKKADLSDAAVIDGMIEEMAYKAGDDTNRPSKEVPASFKARGAFVSNLLGGIALKSEIKGVEGDKGYVSKKPAKFIAKQLFDRLGLNQEKLFYELGEKSLVDLYMNEGKWGMAVAGFEANAQSDIESIQKGGVKHPLFNAKFPGSNAFLLDGAYELDQLFTPVEMTASSGNPYTKRASLMLAGSMYVKGGTEAQGQTFEYKTAKPAGPRIQARVNEFSADDIKNFTKLPGFDKYGSRYNTVQLSEMGVDKSITNAKQFADKLAAFDGPLKGLAKAIARIPGLDKVRFEITDGYVPLAHMTASGSYGPDNKANWIWQSDGKLLRMGDTNENNYLVGIHELMHWVTMDSVMANQKNPDYKALERIYTFIKGDDRFANINEEEKLTLANYGVYNFKEFMAEILVNPEFRANIDDITAANKEEFLKGLEKGSNFGKDFEESGLGVAIYNAIVRAIEKMLGTYSQRIDFDKSLMENAVELSINTFLSKGNTPTNKQGRADDDSDSVENERGFAKTFPARGNETVNKIEADAKTYFVVSNKQTTEEVNAFMEGRNPEDVLDYLLAEPKDIPGRVRIWMSGVVMDRIDEAIVAAKEAGDTKEVDRLSTKQAQLINQISPLGTELGQAIQAFRRFYENASGSAAMLNYFTNNVLSKIEKEAGRKLTEEEIATITEMAKKIQEAPKGLPKDEATFELGNYAGKLAPINAMDLAEAIWYAHILSGITTQSTNFFANFYNTFAEGMVTGIREAVKTRSLMPMIYGARGFLGGLAIGARDGADVLLTGLTPQDADKYNNKNILEYMSWKQTKVGKLMGGKVGGVLDYAGGLSPKVLKYVGRALAATDAAFSRANSEAISNMMAYTQALEEGKTNPTVEIKTRVDEILNKTSEKVAEARQQATDEGYATDSRRYKRRVYQILEQGRDKDMLKEAAIYGKKVTLNYEPEGFMRPVYQLALGLQQSTKLTKMFLPFTRIVVNLTENALNYTPLGFWKAATGTTSTDGGRRKLTKDERADFAIKATLGLATFVGLAALTGDDEDDLFDITANGSGNVIKNYELRKAGWRPYSIKLKDGRYISYKDWPIMPVLSAIGAMHDHEKYSNEKEPAPDAMIALQGMVNSLYEKSVMKGLQDFVEIFSPKQEYNKASTFGDRIVNWGADQAKSLAISNFTQQSIKFTGEYMNNPIKAAKGAERIYRDIPYLNDGLNPIIDVFGEPVTPSTSEKLLPITMAKVSKDAILSALNENGVFIGKPQTRDVFVNDTDETTRPMTDKEYYDFTKKSGQLTKQFIIEDWKDIQEILTIKDKKERREELQLFISELVAEARADAMEELFD